MDLHELTAAYALDALAADEAEAHEREDLRGVGDSERPRTEARGALPRWRERDRASPRQRSGKRHRGRDDRARRRRTRADDDADLQRASLAAEVLLHCFGQRVEPAG